MSGWTLDSNHALILEIDTYQPLQGSSYIELPKDILDSKAVVNIKNEDQACFKWSILAALHPVSVHPERLSHYERYRDELDFTGIEFPVTIDKISKFEKQNPGISVTVIGVSNEKTKKKKTVSTLMSMRVPNEKLVNHVTLLYWRRGEDAHYAWVKSPNRLLSRLNKHHPQTFFCERCFQGFTRPDLLQKHGEMCCHFPVQVTKTVDKEIKFTSWAKIESTLFRVYADFECLLQEEEDEEDHGRTRKLQKHIPCSFAWVLISDHPDVDSYVKLYRPTFTEDMSTDEVGEMVVDELILKSRRLVGNALGHKAVVRLSE